MTDWFGRLSNPYGRFIRPASVFPWTYSRNGAEFRLVSDQWPAARVFRLDDGGWGAEVETTRHVSFRRVTETKLLGKFRTATAAKQAVEQDLTLARCSHYGPWEGKPVAKRLSNPTKDWKQIGSRWLTRLGTVQIVSVREEPGQRWRGTVLVPIVKKRYLVRFEDDGAEVWMRPQQLKAGPL